MQCWGNVMVNRGANFHRPVGRLRDKECERQRSQDEDRRYQFLHSGGIMAHLLISAQKNPESRVDWYLVFAKLGMCLTQVCTV